MSSELIVANVVRQIIVKAWTDPNFKKQVVDTNRNVIKDLAEAGFVFPKYGNYDLYPDIRIVECKLGQVSYIVLPPKPTETAPDLTDLAVVAARGNTVLGI